MPMINITEPVLALTAVLLFVLVLWFAYESKKSALTGIMLFVFIAILVMHSIEFSMGNLTAEGLSVALRSIIFDLIFVFLSFISYLWVDDVESKFKKKKAIDNSLDWFWSKI